MNNDLQIMVMGDGGPAAYFTWSWTMRAAASWMLRYHGGPMCNEQHFVKGLESGIRYESFARGFYDRLGTLLLFSKEEWAPATINGREVPATRWRHLSMSFHESDIKAGPESYGRMRQVLPRDAAATAKWIDCFFGSHQRYLLCEPPNSEHGKKFDVWHYRLLCDENWLPPRGRSEVPDSAFNDAGWMTYKQAQDEQRLHRVMRVQ